MDSRKFRYTLVWDHLNIILFDSQFQFFSQDQCLRHYEKGLKKDLFTFDRSSVDRVWSELTLWGLIGRLYPVELVRTLCAFGCEIQMDTQDESLTIKKSYWPVTYFIPMNNLKMKSLRYTFYRALSQTAEEHIPLLLELDERLLLGSYYITRERDADMQLPVVSRLLENDLCLPPGTFQDVLSQLFLNGCRIVGQSENVCQILAEKDLVRNVIRGYGLESSLFYVGQGTNAA